MTEKKMKLSFANFTSQFLMLPSLEKAGFFLWPSFAGDKLTHKEKELLKIAKPSGALFFKRNLSSPEQSKKLIQTIKNIVENNNNPIFKTFITSIDEEGGRVSRLPVPNIRGKSALEFADSKDEEGLKNQILNQCAHAKAMGINCLLAPVADILTEPKNTVMGDRCFGREAQTVTHYATFTSSIILSQNMYSCAKHFPGHGNTSTDSHKEVSVSNAKLSELKSREWEPFRKLIENKVPFIMAAHVLLPQIDSKNPATLSYKILTEQLKYELNFDGLILSDDLRMNAIAHHYNNTSKKQESCIEEKYEKKKLNDENDDDSYLKLACIDALNAGCDILLSCQSIEKEFIILQSIATQLEKDTNFFKEMTLKAYKIYEKL